MTTESRAKRWEKACLDASDAISRLQELRDEYQDWRDNLPEGLDSSPVAEKLDAVLELALDDVADIIDEAAVADLPLGFGRD